MPRPRHHLLAALAVLPVLAFTNAAFAADPPSGHSPGTPMETLEMVMQDIPGPEYAKANQLKTKMERRLFPPDKDGIGKGIDNPLFRGLGVVAFEDGLHESAIDGPPLAGQKLRQLLAPLLEGRRPRARPHKGVKRKS